MADSPTQLKLRGALAVKFDIAEFFSGFRIIEVISSYIVRFRVEDTVTGQKAEALVVVAAVLIFVKSIHRVEGVDERPTIVVNAQGLSGFLRAVALDDADELDARVGRIPVAVQVATEAVGGIRGDNGMGGHGVSFRSLSQTKGASGWAVGPALGFQVRFSVLGSCHQHHC